MPTAHNGRRYRDASGKESFWEVDEDGRFVEAIRRDRPTEGQSRDSSAEAVDEVAEEKEKELAGERGGSGGEEVDEERAASQEAGSSDRGSGPLRASCGTINK